MAVARVNILAESNATPGTSFATSSISPVAGRLYLLTVAVKNGASVDPLDPTVSGAGLTWVLVGGINYDITSSSRRRICVFRALGSSPSAGALTIDFAGVTHTGVSVSIDEFTGMDTSGTNGSGAIVQAVTNRDTGTPSSLTVTLAAFSNINNATWGGFSNSNAPGVLAAGSGFTGVSNTTGSDTNVNIMMLTEFRIDNDTSVDIGQSVNLSELGGVAVEIAIGPALPVGTLTSMGAGI